MQVRELTEYCQRRGWAITKIYEDRSSGSDPNRKMLLEMMNDCKRRKLDVVLCWKLDRVFRSLRGMVQVLAELQELGTEFVSLTDNLNLETSQGRLMAHLISAFSEFEVELIRSRVRSGLMAARARGVVLGRRPTVTAEIEQQVVTLRRQNLSIRSIEREIKKKISKTSIERILRKHGCTTNPMKSGGSNG